MHQMKLRRTNRGALAQIEAYFIGSFISYLPDRLTPDHLTALSVSGALLSAASVLLLPLSPHFLELFLVGLALNWFGDSFDGALARFRGCERPNVGFLIDKTSDVFSFLVIFAALSMSKIFTPVAAAMLTVTFLINNFYLLMRLVVDRSRRSLMALTASAPRKGACRWGFGPCLVRRTASDSR